MKYSFVWDLKQFAHVLHCWHYLKYCWKVLSIPKSHWNTSFDCYFKFLNRKQGIIIDKIPVIFYSEEVNKTKGLWQDDTCQEHVQANSEQNKLKQKLKQVLKSWLISINKIFRFAKLII